MSIKISELDSADLPINGDSLLEISEYSDGNYRTRSVEVRHLMSGSGMSFRFPISYLSDNFGETVSVDGPTYSELVDAFGREFDTSTATFSVHLSAAMTLSNGTIKFGSSVNNIIYNSQDYSFTTYIGSGGVHDTGAMMPVIPSNPYTQNVLTPVVSDVRFWDSVVFQVFAGLPDESLSAWELFIEGFVDVSLPAYIPPGT